MTDMSDPLRGIDFSERIKPLMQDFVLLDQQRCAEIANLKRQYKGAVADVERMRPVYEAACAWADSSRPVTDGSAGRLHDAIDHARGQ
jgi:hypothetical protein